MSTALAILGFWLGLWLGVIFHEAGHFICARLGKLPVRQVRAGMGPLLRRWQFGQTAFELRLIPWSGAVAIAPDFHRGKATLVVLGGVLGNIGLLVIAGMLDASLGLKSPMHSLLTSIAIAQYLMIALNLIPHFSKAGGKQSASDGLLLLVIALRPITARLFLKHRLSAYQMQPVARPGGTAFAARLAYELSSDQKWTAPDERLKTIVWLESELQQGVLPVGEELLVLDVLITRGLMADDPEPLSGKLDQWSLRAMELGGHLATIRGSRGSVLAMLGRYSEARSLLETVPTGEDAPAIDVLMTKLFLARALWGLGEQSTASCLITEARAFANAKKAVPSLLKLIAQVEAEIAAGPDEVESIDGALLPNAPG